MKHIDDMNETYINDFHKIIGQNVKRIRTSKNISQLSLALAIGHKAVGTISMAELNINKKHFELDLINVYTL